MNNSQSTMPTAIREFTASPEIANALFSMFGHSHLDNVTPLAGGRSGALVYLMTIADMRYILRKVDPTRPLHTERAEREYACMRIASERGIAPKVHYTDVVTGISISDHVTGTPIGRSPEQIKRVAQVLRHLHEGPPFPVGISLTDAIQYFDASIRATHSAGLPADLIATMLEISQVTMRFGQSAPCHNDLNPTNMLATPETIYFLDWDTAGMSDPFLDLAELGIFNFPTADLRAELLAAYLQRTPSEEERARATLARVMALGFYAAGFFQIAAQLGTPVDDTLQPLPLPELFNLLQVQQQQTPPGVVAVSLFAEMMNERALEGYNAAKQLLWQNQRE